MRRHAILTAVAKQQRRWGVFAVACSRAVAPAVRYAASVMDYVARALVDECIAPAPSRGRCTCTCRRYSSPAPVGYAAPAPVVVGIAPALAVLYVCSCAHGCEHCVCKRAVPLQRQS